MRGGRGNRYQAGSGTLALLSPSPTLATGTNTFPCCGVVSPDGLHLYAGLDTAGNVQQMARASDGSLTNLSTATIAAPTNPRQITISPDGKHVYATRAGGDKVRAFSRNSSTGLLTLIADYVGVTYPIGVIVSPDGAYVYAVNKAPGAVPSISMYSRNSSTGVLTALSPATISFGVSDAQGIGIAMYGTSVYVGCFNNSTFYAFTQDSGTGLLSAHSTPSYTAGSKPAWIGIAPDGTSVYVVNDGAATVSQYSRATDGTLTSIGSALAAGNGPYSIAITPDGKHVYIGGSDGQTVYQYSRDTGTGLLTAKAPAFVRSQPGWSTVVGSGGPQSICISPDGQNLYTFGTTPSHAIAAFHIRP